MMYLQNNQNLKVRPDKKGIMLLLETHFPSGPIQVGIVVEQELTWNVILESLETLKNLHKTVTFGLTYGIGAEKLSKLKLN
jgi:hypothetical protein